MAVDLHRPPPPPPNPSCQDTRRSACKKGKSVRLQAWSSPEDFWKLRFPDFMTTAQDIGKVVSLTHPQGNAPGTRFCRPHGHSAIGRILCQ